MATVTFNSAENPVAEAQALSEALNIWLSEQTPVQRLHPSEVKFTYGEDGYLRAIVVTEAGE
jgi:hypothetical protein